MTLLDPSPRRRSGWFRVAAIAVAVVMGATLAACGGNSKPSSSPSSTPPASQDTAGGHRLASEWPLTGLPVHGPLPKHPVLAVKIPNTAESYPQVGMAKADMVSEELVEGGISRLAVFYYQHVPSLVGPVRSMRASDIGIVKPLNALLVASGAAPPTLRRLHAKHVKFVTGGASYFRDSSAAPYNLMVHLGQLAKSTKKQHSVPPNYLPWGSEKDFKGKGKAKSVAVRFSAGHTTMWKYAGGKYHNTNSYAPAKYRFTPKSVLVLRVREGNAGYLDPAGNPVPETIFSGKGHLLLFHDGKVVRGTWHKSDLAGKLSLRTKSGALKIPAGRVWIELAPVDKAGGHVSWHK